MKIEKLFTLSHLVDFVQSLEFNPNDGNSIEEFMINNLAVICRYNSLLKQPLKKEMFVNEIEKPDPNKVYTCGMSFDTDYIVCLNKWEESERKVILNRVEYFNGLIKYRLNYEYGGAMECRSHTLNDLAEATKGQLELQNVEL